MVEGINSNTIKNSTTATHKYRKLVITAAFVLFGIAAAVILPSFYGQQSSVKNTVDTFFTLLTEKNFDKALEHCTGQAKYVIKSNLERAETISESRITLIRHEKININNEIANTVVLVEKVSGVKTEAQRYSVDLIKKNDEWKLYSVDKLPPGIPGGKTVQDEQEIRKTYIAYLTCLIKNQWEEAGGYLIGTALDAHIQVSSVLNSSPVLHAFNNLNTVFIAGNKKECLYKINYIADDRPVEVLVIFYRAQDSWKIEKVSQV
jgi:hypothetical protein